jgi:hypothetical protein
MDHDASSDMWFSAEQPPDFHSLAPKHRIQRRGNCVPTAFSLLTGEDPTAIRQHIDVRNPVFWSCYLQQRGKKLADYTMDLRRLGLRVRQSNHRKPLTSVIVIIQVPRSTRCLLASRPRDMLWLDYIRKTPYVPSAQGAR